MIILAFVVIALVAGFIANYLVGRKRKYEPWELFVVGTRTPTCGAELQ